RLLGRLRHPARRHVESCPGDGHAHQPFRPLRRHDHPGPVRREPRHRTFGTPRMGRSDRRIQSIRRLSHMKDFCGIAAAVAVLGVTAAGAATQSLPGGEISTARAGFGLALALGEDELFVGEPNNSTRPGEIHIFSRGADGWAPSGRLTAPDAEASDGFGQRILLAGNTLFVAVPSYENNRGTVHVFEREAGGWSHTAELAGSDMAGMNRFGTAIATTGEFAFVSAPLQQQGAGAVYVFRRGPDGWTE